MTTRLYTHDLSVEHITPPGHPERPDRIKVLDETFAQPNFDALIRIEAPAADTAWFEVAHPASHLKMVKDNIPETGIATVDADTSASPKSWEVVTHVCGAAMDAVDAVFNKKTDNAFVSMRPPGHHAEKTTAMGFCLVNNIAIAARYAQQTYGAERVAIVDFDVHHGNGTQDLVEDDPRILFCSSHQSPLYPGTGAAHETGVGNVVNVPLPDGTGSAAFRNVWDTVIFPRVDAFKPDLIVISAGFDAHKADPLAGMMLETEDFAWVTRRICDLADLHCAGRVVSALEGGYDLDALGASAAAHVGVLEEASR